MACDLTYGNLADVHERVDLPHSAADLPQEVCAPHKIEIASQSTFVPPLTALRASSRIWARSTVPAAIPAEPSSASAISSGASADAAAPALDLRLGPPFAFPLTEDLDSPPGSSFSSSKSTD